MSPASTHKPHKTLKSVQSSIGAMEKVRFILDNLAEFEVRDDDIIALAWLRMSLSSS
ncbi:hypothetical protein [Shewanella psychropiezotolerans]|uniref:hypothetical protein n=1 Tax=Shewanella psychropiezotolerans TaxID=2593655 RepID=UPI00163D89E5|nr:hypothetical protein [Shewanella psychropiezotolerans]